MTNLKSCETCVHALQSPQEKKFYCLNSNRNKNTDREKRCLRANEKNCKYWSDEK